MGCGEGDTIICYLHAHGELHIGHLLAIWVQEHQCAHWRDIKERVHHTLTSHTCAPYRPNEHTHLHKQHSRMSSLITLCNQQIWPGIHTCLMGNDIGWLKEAVMKTLRLHLHNEYFSFMLSIFVGLWSFSKCPLPTSHITLLIMKKKRLSTYSSFHRDGNV